MSEYTEYPVAEHFNRMQEASTELQKRVGGLTEMLIATDRLLANMGLLLNISQPATDGKLGIRWWLNGRGKREPVFVEWKRKRFGNKKFYPVRLHGNIVRRQKRHSAFKVNEQETETILHFAVELLRIRGVLMNALSNVSRTEFAIVKNNARTIEYQANHLKSVGPRIRENNEIWTAQKESGLDWKV